MKRVKIDYDNISITQINHLIDEWIRNERDRALLKRRLIDGIGYEQLSEEFYLAPQRIKVIIYRAEAQLYNHIK